MRNPSATKRGPGRRHKQGHTKTLGKTLRARYAAFEALLRSGVKQ